MRLIFFIIISLVSVLTTFPVACAAAVVYSLRYEAYDIVWLGAFIDIAFGHTSLDALPLYTIAFGSVMICAELAKPYFAFYNDRHATL